MTSSQIEQLLAAVRRLPSAARLRVAQRVVDLLSADDQQRLTQVANAAAVPSPVSPSMLGLFADEPELVDEVCRQAYSDRTGAWTLGEE